jgi:alpha-tubulin suppressor-like RCC1 family protein
MLARLGQALLVGLTLIIVACGNEATAVPAATDAPAAPVATSAPAATTAPSATTVPAATAQPSIPFSSVSAGSEHTCGVKTDGSVVCWGNDTERQARPPGGSFASVSAGPQYTCGALPSALGIVPGAE